MTTLAEQLAAAEERVEKLRARQRDREARARKQRDKIRNRAMVLWGASTEYGIKHASTANQRVRLVADMRTRIEGAWAGRDHRDRDAAIAYLDRLVASLPSIDSEPDSQGMTINDTEIAKALRDDFS